MGRVNTIWETMCVPSETLCPFSKGCKWAYMVFHKKRLETKVLPWKQHGRWYSVSFVMYISCAKFEEHYSNISRDILDSVFYCSSGTIYDVITFFVCIIQIRKYLYNEKRYCKKENPFFFTLKNLLNKQQLFRFSVLYRLNN